MADQYIVDIDIEIIDEAQMELIIEKYKGEKGDPGDPTELIDDTAGDGDTDKTWSADKLADEFDDVLREENITIDPGLIPDPNPMPSYLVMRGSSKTGKMYVQAPVKNYEAGEGIGLAQRAIGTYAGKKIYNKGVNNLSMSSGSLVKEMVTGYSLSGGEIAYTKENTTLLTLTTSAHIQLIINEYGEEEAS